MTVLFGHPTGTPFAYNCALAHFAAGWLESFCVPWMPSARTQRVIEYIQPVVPAIQRLSRRYFPPLANAPKTQGRVGEMRRLIIRGLGGERPYLPLEANAWLMRTMVRLCSAPAVSVVHAYEDCSLWQFAKAKRLGKACVYDMPIGYYSAWEGTQASLLRKYSDWLPAGALPKSINSDQKRKELELADLVLAPSDFVADSVRMFYPDKAVTLAPYGVDSTLWSPAPQRDVRDEITFLFAGQCSVRKGVPLLLAAWQAADLKHARLQLVGPWLLSEAKKRQLPPRCDWIGPVSTQELRTLYHQADVFVFPTNFEGRALVVGEALASGLPVLTTHASGVDDLVDDECGRVCPPEDFEAMVEGLRWFNQNRDCLPALSRAARAKAERCTWEYYRQCVTESVRRLA